MVTQQAAQAYLIAQTQKPVTQAWSLVDQANLQATLPKFTQALQGIVQQYGTASYALARKFYLQERAAAKVGGKFTPKPPPRPPVAQVEKSVSWATRELWSDDPTYADSNLKAAQTNVQGVVNNLVLGVGRQMTVRAVQEDRKARGWAREVEPGACSFCVLLATRGAVYKTDATASFRSHPHCECMAVPVFGQYEPTAEIRHAQQLYQQAKATPGVSTLKAFRQLVEGRSD